MATSLQATIPAVSGGTVERKREGTENKVRNLGDRLWPCRTVSSTPSGATAE